MYHFSMIIFNRILVLFGKNYVKVKNVLQCDTRQPELIFIINHLECMSP